MLLKKAIFATCIFGKSKYEIKSVLRALGIFFRKPEIWLSTKTWTRITEKLTITKNWASAPKRSTNFNVWKWSQKSARALNRKVWAFSFFYTIRKLNFNCEKPCWNEEPCFPMGFIYNRTPATAEGASCPDCWWWRGLLDFAQFQIY